MSASLLDSIPLVLLPESGLFKYVLLRLSLDGRERTVVRGGLRPSGSDGFHQDLLSDCRRELARAGAAAADVACLGGGRIQSEAGAIRIFGYSVQFGQANHEAAAALVRAAYPARAVECSNEGY